MFEYIFMEQHIIFVQKGLIYQTKTILFKQSSRSFSIESDTPQLGRVL